MNNRKGEFPGQLYIDGKPEGEGVSVFLTENCLSLSKAGEHLRKTKVLLSPFNQIMLFSQDEGRIKEGYFYEIKGSRVGGISVGPLGHPGDGEFDYWPMILFKLDVKYLPSHISIDVNGITGPGTSGFDGDKVLTPSGFFVHFEIPKSQIQEFFQLTDIVNGNFFEVFNRVFGAA